MAAKDDKSNKDGTAGHLHLFVNRDPTAAGPIPTGDAAIIHTPSTTVEVPAELLKTGENVIWVVLGYADHSPFIPTVVDKVVTVS